MSEPKKKELLQFSDSESDSESDKSNHGHLKINKTFADDYEKRKRRQELLNAQQNDEDTSDYESSSDESEDEDAELLTSKLDLQILKTINALRSKDKSIYDRSKKFFSEEEEEYSSSHEDEAASKKSKPKTYKDLVREEILQKMEKGDDSGENLLGSDDDEPSALRSEQTMDRMKKLAYDDEQRALREAFLKNDDNVSDNEDKDSDEDSWLVKKKGSVNANEDNEKERLVEIEVLSKTVGADGSTLTDPKGEVKDGEQFLLDFIKNKKWVDHQDSDSDDDDDDGDDKEDIRMERNMNGDEEDDNSDASLKELDRMDEFESKYNFRFEEANENSGAGLSVIGYSRSALSDTVRRQDETRKMKRQQRKERKEAERKAKEERLRRLKNAKKEELEERIKQIKSVLGENVDADVDQEVVAKLMEGDFDPDKFEELMSKMYNDDFYEKEEQEWKSDLDVKQSLLRDDEDGGGIVYDEGDGDIYDNADDDDAMGEDEEDDDNQYIDDQNFGTEDVEKYNHGTAAQDSKESILEKKLKERMLDELYKLDYEDIIGDMPTRFKYRKVQPNRYGLTPEEILFARDTSLKQYVSLKKMAPYIEDGEYVPGAKKRRRFRDMSRQEIEEEMQKYASKNVKEDAADTHGEDHDEQPKKKRRRQKKKKSTNMSAEGEPQSQKNVQHKSQNKEQYSESKEDKLKSSQVSLDAKKIDPIETKTGTPAEGKDTDKILQKSKHHDSSFESIPKKTKKRKKSDKKTNVKVRGVAASRLTSYGL